MSEETVHKPKDPRDDNSGITVVGPGDKFECSICGDVVGRFSIHYHGDGQYCPSCWNEVEPHKSDAECTRCGDEFRRDPYESNLVTWEDGERVAKPDICDGCTSEVFGDD